MLRAWPGALALAWGLAAVTPARAAYLDAHPSGHDVHVTLDGAARADVDEAIGYTVASGNLKGFDLHGLDPRAEIVPDVTVTGDDGSVAAAHVGPRVWSAREKSAGVAPGEDPGLRVDVLDPKGLKRGNYMFHLRYKVDLAPALQRDGALWRLTWRSPPLAEGIDAMRVVFDLPAAPTEPRLARAETSDDPSADDDVTLASIPTLRRSAERDALDIVRPHVARDEAAVWAIRVDPRAFPAVSSPELRPPPPPPVPRRETSFSFGLLALLGLGLAGSAFAYMKLAHVARDLAGRKLAPRPLVALPVVARAAAFGALLAFAVHLELRDAMIPAALVLALAIATATHLAPRAVLAPRGPGAWRSFSAEEAFGQRLRGDAFDATTLRGAIAFAASLALLAVAAVLLGRIDPGAPGLVALDATILAPLFWTGTRRQLPPDRARHAAPVLRALYKRLRSERALRVGPWARVPAGRRRPDELRLRVLPRAPLPGLLAVEVGLAWRPTVAGFAWAPEVLVRVHDASAAAAKLTSLAPFARPVTGRRPDERVVRLAPNLPTHASLRALVARLGRELVDRRLVVPGVTKPTWPGEDRRLPPNVRAEQVAHATVEVPGADRPQVGAAHVAPAA